MFTFCEYLKKLGISDEKNGTKGSDKQIWPVVISREAGIESKRIQALVEKGHPFKTTTELLD